MLSSAHNPDSFCIRPVWATTPDTTPLEGHVLQVATAPSTYRVEPSFGLALDMHGRPYPAVVPAQSGDCVAVRGNGLDLWLAVDGPSAQRTLVAFSGYFALWL